MPDSQQFRDRRPGQLGRVGATRAVEDLREDDYGRHLRSSERLWEEQQLANRDQEDIERRAWLKRFALALALIAFTLIAAKALAVESAGVDSVRV
jgi:hypothetical protein